MNTMDHEEQEHLEHAAHSGHRGIGLTTAVVAVLLAISTMLGHRMHTEEVLLQAKASDQWAFFQAKNIRANMFGADAKLATLLGEKGSETAGEFAKKSSELKEETEAIKKEAEDLEKESKQVAHQADFLDLSEIFLEVSIVLCSVALLSQQAIFWKSSFLSTAIGVVLVVVAYLHRG